ncbi:MAG: hypothetical protein Kow001_19450 [Acidobacteriota bacterium]
MWILLLLGGLLLAYTNGANDNFKGTASLLGSGTCGYRRALTWACVTTFAGSLAALWLARDLLEVYSGKGLVVDAVVARSDFMATVGIGAALTVGLAVWLGLPVSTTHALTGALVGAGLSYGPVHWTVLKDGFLVPLLVSPVLAALLCAAVYLLFRAARLRLGIDKESCICVGPVVVAARPVVAAGEQLLGSAATVQVKLSSEETCREFYCGRFAGVPVSALVDAAHYLTAGAVSFARGLNDTPKIAALLLAGSFLAPAESVAVVAVAMGVGGWLSARRVATTMSFRVTRLNPGQGFASNLTASLMVIFASRWGLPVSTTHVTVGSLCGIGAVSGQVQTRMVSAIVLAWLVTLPLAAGLAAAASLLVR